MGRIQYADPLGNPHRLRTDELGARQLLRDRRNYNSWSQSGLLSGGTQFKLIYTGTSNGVWAGAGPLIFTPGDWTFIVTQSAWLMLKGCGPGGWGGLAPNPVSTQGSGGGGGAYTLGSGFTFRAGYTFTVNVPAAGTMQPTLVVHHGVEWILHMGGGGNGTRWDQTPAGGTPGGVVSAGIAGQANGPNGGRFNPNVAPGSTTGTGGGGQGGGGNLGGTGAFAGVTGGSGESGAGAPSSPPTGFNGGCGGYGGGLVVSGYPYGRGGGGAGEVADGIGGGNSSLYVYAATSGVVQITRP